MFKPWTTFLFELIQYFAFTFTAKQFVRPHLQLHASTCFTTANPSTTHAWQFLSGLVMLCDLPGNPIADRTVLDISLLRGW